MGENLITVQLPLKAIIMYAYYLSQDKQWEDRQVPDQLATLIGSETDPNALFTVTIKAKKLSFLLANMLQERNGVIRDFYRSVIQNLPVISGYTALQTQITTKAADNGDPQKDAAQWVLDAFVLYRDGLESLYTENYNRGLAWIND